jgi:hypothetical protein
MRPAHILEAERNGALAKITFVVVDDEGRRVPDAMVTGGFFNYGRGKHDFSRKTDADGAVTLENICRVDLNLVVEKNGYYRTRAPYSFFKPGFDCVKDGRWIPWNPIIEVVLKRKINPLAMAVVTYDSQHHDIPFVGKEIGFDLFENDWVAPAGKGKRADFYLLFDWDGSKYNEYNGSSLVFLFRDPFSGAYKIKTDEFSTLKSRYCANTHAMFASEMKFSYIRGRKASETFNGQLKGDECLILRVRTEVDRDGNLVSAHYVKIYGPMMFGYALKTPGSMGMRYYLNPNKNDPNLEADTMKNLLNPGDLSFSP